MTEHRYTDVSTALPLLMDHVLKNGEEVGSRGGRVKELLYPHIVLQEPWRREVLTPLRRASLPAQIAETMWLLAGRDDVEWLSHYLPRAADFSDDGIKWRGAYGPRLRAWQRRTEGDVIDQLAWVVDLLRKDPLSRRAVVTLYDPDRDSKDGKDIPCNNWVHFQSRLGQLHAHVVIRSNDLMWGWSGINAFEWSALQEVVAGLLGIEMGELHFSVSSLHLYETHWDRARRIAADDQGWMAASASPRFDGAAVGRSLESFDKLVEQWFAIEGDLRAGVYPESTHNIVDVFPEPMLRSWLQVIAWWWSRDASYLKPLHGTALESAAHRSPRVDPVVEAETLIANTLYPAVDPFTEYVVKLQADKHAVYGDSWKRRGEQIGIRANIARKFDRLGVAGGGDTAADTVVDLLVYLCLYRLWMTDEGRAASPVQRNYIGGFLADQDEAVSELLRSIPEKYRETQTSLLLTMLVRDFDVLEAAGPDGKVAVVDNMIPRAATVARRLWLAEQPTPEGESIDAWIDENKVRFWRGYDA